MSKHETSNSRPDTPAYSITSLLHCALVAVLIVYFYIATIERLKLQQEQFEVAQLRIKVLKLQLQEFE